MINTKTLRNHYRQERLKLNKSAKIGGIILIMLSAIILSLAVRVFCSGIMIIYDLIK